MVLAATTDVHPREKKQRNLEGWFSKAKTMQISFVLVGVAFY